jgi:hypothetical protein
MRLISWNHSRGSKTPTLWPNPMPNILHYLLKDQTPYLTVSIIGPDPTSNMTYSTARPNTQHHVLDPST